LAIIRGPVMPQPYSDDLRCKLLEAWEAGAGSLRELAEQFRVSWAYSKKVRKQQLKTGKKERPLQSHHGPVSRITDDAQQLLRDWLREQPDLTQAELSDRLQRIGIQVCKSRVGQVLQQMGLRRKKNRSMRKNAIRLSISNGAPSSLKKSARSRPNA
jgi:transposase